MFEQLRPELERLIGTYVDRNGLYRIEEVLSPVVQSAGGAAGLGRSLARSAKDPVGFLAGIVDEQWVPTGARPTLYARLTEWAETDAAKQFG